MGKKGTLYLVSGFSGVGKNTVLNIVLEKMPDLHFSVSCTSRAPREGEKDGVNYFFISEKEFEEKTKDFFVPQLDNKKVIKNPRNLKNILTLQYDCKLCKQSESKKSIQLINRDYWLINFEDNMEIIINGEPGGYVSDKNDIVFSSKALMEAQTK